MHPIQQPLWKRGNFKICRLVRVLPTINLPRFMIASGSEHIAAIGAYIDASEQANFIFESSSRIRKVEVDSTPAGMNSWAIRQRAVFLFQVAERFFPAVSWVDV